MPANKHAKSKRRQVKGKIKTKKTQRERHKANKHRGYQVEERSSKKEKGKKENNGQDGANPPNSAMHARPLSGILDNGTMISPEKVEKEDECIEER